MDLIRVVDLIRKVFMIAYVVFIIWCVIKYVRTTKLQRLSARDWFGSFGLAAGVLSSGLFAWFYLFLILTHRLIAHGAMLWIYYYIGLALAIVCLICGLAGRNWLRLSSIVISLVMLFQWYGRMIVGIREEAIVQLGMLISLSGVAIFMFIIHSFSPQAKQG